MQEHNKEKSERLPLTLRDYNYYPSSPPKYVSAILTANAASTDLIWHACIISVYVRKWQPFQRDVVDNQMGA